MGFLYGEAVEDSFLSLVDAIILEKIKLVRTLLGLVHVEKKTKNCTHISQNFSGIVSCEKNCTDILAFLFLNNIIFFYSKNFFFPLSTFHVSLIDLANVYIF